MTKTGWWAVEFQITLDGEEVRFSDLDEASREHIAELIRDGYTNGEVVVETDSDEESEDSYECQ